MARGDGWYQVFPDLRPEEYAALKADIEKRGVMVPIEVDEEGHVLDGHNRKRIADELGIECPTVVREFENEQEKREHVVKINLLRRHMDPVTWAEAFERLAEQRGIRLGTRGPQRSETDTVSVLASELGVSDRTARRRLGTLDLPDPLKERVRCGDLSTREATRRAQQSDAAKKRKALHGVTKVRAEEKRKATRQKLIQRERIRNGDVRMKVRDFHGGREVVIYDVVKGTVGVLTEIEALERILDYYYEPWPGDPRQKPLPGHLRAEGDGLSTPLVDETRRSG